MQQIGDSEWPRPGRDTIGKWVPANHACPPGNPSNSFKPSYPRRSLPRQHFGPISPSHKCCKQKTYGPVKPFRCNTYKKHRVGVGNDFPRHGTFNADSHLPYTLPSSVSGNSFVCHSYENCRVSPTIIFPMWDPEEHGPTWYHLSRRLFRASSVGVQHGAMSRLAHHSAPGLTIV